MNDIHPTRGRRIAGADPAALPASENFYAYRAGKTPRQHAELDRLRTRLDAQARRPWDEGQAAPGVPAAIPIIPTSRKPEGPSMPDLNSQGGRSAMGRASDARAFKPYFPGGRPVRALVAPELRDRMPVPAREEPAPPPEPGHEPAREFLPEPAPEPESDPEPAPGRDPEPEASAEPAPADPPASRCKKCTYLTTAIGHKIACEDKTSA